MQQDNQKSSADNNTRRHKAARNGANSCNKRGQMYTIDEKHATTKEKNAFDELFREGKAVDSDINLGIYKKSKTGKEKIIIADSGAETTRYRNENNAARLMMMLSVVSLIIAALAAISLFLNTPYGQKLSNQLNFRQINEHGDFDFGEFDGMTTIGDSREEVYRILGKPDSDEAKNGINLLYYGYSYIIIENDIVTGYYRAPDEDLKVTVGSAKPDVERMIFPYDNARRVIDKLGSPDHYLKHKWIYFNRGINYEKTDKGKTLTVVFDDKYIVDSITLK